jgi:outer membrane protein
MHKINYTPFWLGILLCLSIHSNGFAQQEPLSLQQAIAKGLKHNFQIRIASERQEIAGRNNNLMEAGLLPSLNVSANQGYNLNDVDNPASFIRGEYTNNSGRLAADINWTLFRGMSVWITKQQLALLYEQSDENATMVVENTLQGISLAYLNSLAQAKQMEANKKLMAISLDQLKRTKARKNLGAAGTFELLQAENSYLQDSTKYLRQEASYHQAVRSLQMLIGDSANTQLTFTDLAEETFPLLDKQSLKKGLFESNTNLRQQYLNVQLAENTIKQQRTGMFPTLTASTGANTSNNKLTFNDNSISGGQSNYYIQFALNFNLFNNLKVQRAIKNAKQSAVIADLTSQELKLQLGHELENQYEQYHNRLILKDLNNTLLNNATLQLSMAADRLNSGAIDSFDFRQLQVSYLNANAQYYLAVFQTMESYLELLKLSGDLLQEVGSR